MAPNPNKLPLITFNSKTLNPSNGTWKSTSHSVREALEDYGCFIVATNKVPSDLRDTMFELANDLFHLPMETKMKNTSDLLGFGYGKYASMPLWEYFGIEGGATVEGTRSFTDLLFPSGHKYFCETAYQYMKLLSEVDQCVIRMVFDSYGIDAKECERLIESTLYLSRFMKYRSPREGEGVMGLFPHSDKSFLAVLDDDFRGLEIKMRNGDWIYPQPSPSTFIVLAGEPLMAWSNGRIHAPVHQVVMRTSEKEVVRNSLGLFSFMTATVEVPEELVDDDEHRLRFMPFNQIDFLKYATTEEGKASKCAIKSYCGVFTGATADC